MKLAALHQETVCHLHGEAIYLDVGCQERLFQNGVIKFWHFICCLCNLSEWHDRLLHPDKNVCHLHNSETLLFAFDMSK